MSPRPTEEFSIASALPAINRVSLDLSRNNTPGRASTAPHSSANQSERSRLHHRLHANSLRTKDLHGSGSHHHHHRRHAKDTIQSAVQLTPQLSFDHFLRPHKNTPESSRRGSQDQRNLDESQAQQAEAERQPRRRVKPEDVTKAKALNAKREEELRESMKSVEQVGMDSTRKLDDTYYSILEKVSVLKSMIASLQQLSNRSRALHVTFQDSSSKLQKSTTEALSAFGGFEGQQSTIDGLVKKLKDSKAKTDSLGGRLEAAKARVKAYEQHDHENQAKRLQRWHIVWGTLGGIMVLIVAALVARHHYAAVRHALGDVGNALGALGGKIENVSYELAPSVRDKASLERVDEDPLLHRLFDDL